MRRTSLTLIALALLLSAGAVNRAVVEVKLYPFDCGRIDVDDMDAFADDGSYAGVSKTLVVACYLIRHPKGDLLWDTGVGDRFAGPAGVTFQPGFVGRVPLTLRSQLRRLGIEPDEIEYLGFSHEHPDHIGNANLFANATWLLNRREHEWAVEHEGTNGKPPALLSAANTARVRMIDGDVDLFGDGSVLIVQAPGHTPGHQVLLVRPTGRRPVVLAGDLWHSRSNYEHDRVSRFNTSRTETISSFRKVRALARQSRRRHLDRTRTGGLPSRVRLGWSAPAPMKPARVPKVRLLDHAR
ncbi:MAG TPA: N-acyl homoserine lactonase family protein [Vicinamibacterales bacterium]